MGDDQNPGPAPEGRAPWERPISHLTGSVHRPPPPRPPTPPPADRPPPGRGQGGGRTGEPSDRLSVADLTNKLGRGGTRAPVAGPADLPPAHPRDPEPASDQLHRAEPTLVVPDGPTAVGAASTRLAASKQRKQHRLKLVGRSAVALVAVMSLVMTGIVWGYMKSTDSGFLQVAALDPDSTDVIDPGGQYGDETYLIVGTDTRAGVNSNLGAGSVADAEGARSDTVILVNIPADRSRVVAVSFPRDLAIVRPSCQAWDNDKGQYTNEINPGADNDKLNSAYALGGPKCLVKVIQKLSGMKIGHFIGMDFSGFETIVNQIGGVEVCTTTPLIDDELGAVLPNAGRQTVDGATALNYVRARKVEAEGNGDYGRIKRQQIFLSSLLRSSLSNKVLLDPGKLNGFINAFTRETFVQNVDTKSLVTLGRSLQKVDAGAITFLTVPTDGTDELGNEVPRLDDIKSIFRAIIDDEPLPGESRKEPEVKQDEAAAGPSTATTPPPAPRLLSVDTSGVSLQVSNASGVTGVAATAAESLGAEGFQIYSVGNYSGTSANTLIRYAPGQAAEAATVAASIPGALLLETSTEELGGMIDVVLGTTFTGTVIPAKPADTELHPTLAPKSTVISGTTVEELPADLAFTNAGDDTCT
ncbi:LCP family protein [Rhodococcus kronopolitis]|uniref:LCP family protein n=1 Tax=Rhodococcus kronopolitis TaxID=1460226 RepID=A0ABV9FQN5_9NOCA